MPDSPKANELGETWTRFFCHWFAASLGVFFRTFLPILNSWADPNVPVNFERWWAIMLFAFSIALLASVVTANSPIRPRELLKSVGLGFALDSARVLADI